MKAFGRTLTVTGWVLIALFVAARVHSWVGSSVALAQIASASQASPRTIPIEDRTVDVSLWSDKRVADFKEALGIPTAPPIAAIRVPRVGIEAPIFPGTDEVTLNRGVGWIKGTATPGSEGNSCLAAHRDGFFRALKDVARGDVVELELDGSVQTYAIESIEIVDPKNVASLAQGKEQALTLVTCYPFYFIGSAPQRFIVRATPTAPPVAGPGTIAPANAANGSTVSRSSD
ncbi:MAG: class D sortase [Thermoanaerobaculia bacterium]